MSFGLLPHLPDGSAPYLEPRAEPQVTHGPNAIHPKHHAPCTVPNRPMGSHAACALGSHEYAARPIGLCSPHGALHPPFPPPWGPHPFTTAYSSLPTGLPSPSSPTGLATIAVHLKDTPLVIKHANWRNFEHKREKKIEIQIQRSNLFISYRKLKKILTRIFNGIFWF